jgi:hypothetical protein
LILAHGVGRLYELPIPLYLYLFGATATVVASFVIRALSPQAPAARTERLIAGAGVARVVRTSLALIAVVGLTLTVVVGVIVRDEGFTLTTLFFWVGFIVGMIVLNAILAGSWEAADPWARLESVYRLEGATTSGDPPPWWVAPVGIYALFWFELVSGGGFEDFFVVMALIAYSLFAFSMRPATGRDWRLADPLSVLFGFAGRVAPFRLTDGGIYAVNPVDSLDDPEAMPTALYVSVFVLLGATTMDNISETVGWTTFLDSTGLASLPSLLVDSVALAAFGLAFYLPFIAAVRIARLGDEHGVVARRFAWSLIPIAIAYVLAHNVSLILTGVPVMIRSLSDPLGRGWNLLGTADLFEGYVASPALVWFAEIILVVGGHILGVLGAHRVALRLAGGHADAVRSQYSLTVLMSVFTVMTLWLLSQPVVE